MICSLISVYHGAPSLQSDKYISMNVLPFQQWMNVLWSCFRSSVEDCRSVNWFIFPHSSASLNLVPLPCSWGSSRWGSSCAVLHIRPLQGGTYVRWWQLCGREGMCGTLHGTGVCAEDHQQGQMQRQGKLQRQKSTAHIFGNKRLLVFKIAQIYQ